MKTIKFLLFALTLGLSVLLFAGLTAPVDLGEKTSPGHTYSIISITISILISFAIFPVLLSSWTDKLIDNYTKKIEDNAKREGAKKFLEFMHKDNSLSQEVLSKDTPLRSSANGEKIGTCTIYSRLSDSLNDYIKTID